MSNVSPLSFFVKPSELIGIRPASPEPKPRKQRAKKVQPATHLSVSIERRDRKLFGRLVRVDNKTGNIEKTLHEFTGMSARDLHHLSVDFDRRMEYAHSLDGAERDEAILAAMRDITKSITLA